MGRSHHPTQDMQGIRNTFPIRTKQKCDLYFQRCRIKNSESELPEYSWTKTCGCFEQNEIKSPV